MSQVLLDVPDDIIETVNVALAASGVPGETPRERFVNWARTSILELVRLHLQGEANRAREEADRRVEMELQAMSAKLGQIK